MKRLRVVHLDSGASWRGGQRQALLLASGLRERGLEPFLIGVPGSPLVTRARAAGLAVAAIPMRADWDIRAARKIRARIRAWNADLVHAHDARSHALALVALLGQRGVPLVVTRRVPFTPRSVRMKYGDRVARFIAISRAVRDAMVAGGVDESRIDVVYSGIEIPQLPVAARNWRDELGWPADSVICAVVGAMTGEKGIDLLDAIAAWLPEPVRGRTRLLLLGGEARGHFSVNGVGAYSAGFVNEIEPAMAGVDVLWHPARAEGLGTAVLDAMALEVPPVAFAVGGLAEVIVNGESGILVPPGDVPAFAAAASRLITESALRRRLGTGARGRSASFSAAAMTKGTEAVYNRVTTG